MNKKNKKVIQKSIVNILKALGEDPNREGLIETPKRVAKAYEELFEGIQYSNSEIAEMFNKCFEHVQTDELVIESNIPIFSVCEHHFLLMFNMRVHVGYIPNGKVIGLSKIARVAEMCSRRLQLQERIGVDILDVLVKILNTKDVIVVIEGEHGCMSARGIKKPGTVTKTAALSGAFKTEKSLRKEFYDLISKGR